MRVLLVEDDKKLGELISAHLKKHGFITDHLVDGMDGLRWAMEGIYDVIILDRMLPGMDGLSILKKLREKNFLTPILMLTALYSLEEKVEGFQAGTDDYLAKPFEMEELSARIDALSRRPRKWENHLTLTFSDFSYDCGQRIISCNDKQSTLSQKEAELLEFFIRNENQTLPRNLLLSRIWGPDAPVEEGSLDTYIYFLRNRLKAIGSRVTIKVVRGVGYYIQKEETTCTKK